jgi:predicted N-acyltransferase
MDVGEHGYWAQMRASQDAPGTKWEQITTNDTTPLAHQYKRILCTVNGTCVMKDTAGTSLTLTMTAGQILPVVPTIIATTSTGTFFGIIE